MTMRFAYTRPDGGMSIVNAAPIEQVARYLGKPVYPEGDATKEPVGYALSKEDYRAHVIERSIPADASYVVELPEDWAPPPDRTFRDAWTFDGKSIAVDMHKARKIHIERLRAMRKPLMAELDTAYMRADETGDAKLKAEVAAQKQALREVTKDPAIEAAGTPDELKAAIPEVLKARP